MKDRRWYLILVAALITQVAFFNQYYLFETKLNLAYIALVLLAFHLKRQDVVVGAAALGWLTTIATTASALSGAVTGLLVGTILYFLVNTSYWSLAWVRTIACMVIVVLVDLSAVIITKDYLLESAFILMLGLFILVNSLFSMMLVGLIPEPSNE